MEEVCIKKNWRGIDPLVYPFIVLEDHHESFDYVHPNVYMGKPNANTLDHYWLSSLFFKFLNGNPKAITLFRLIQCWYIDKCPV